MANERTKKLTRNALTMMSNLQDLRNSSVWCLKLLLIFIPVSLAISLFADSLLAMIIAWGIVVSAALAGGITLVTQLFLAKKIRKLLKKIGKGFLHG
jgi:uncharacterized membrane protein